MNSIDVVKLFNELRVPYPRAAAGLIDDLCLDLGRVLQETPHDHTSIDRLKDLIIRCFRPMDASWPPDSCPWDTAYYTFGRWLWRSLPQFKEAVISITRWPDDKVAECKSDYARLVRCNRDDWVRLAESIDAQGSG